jgi:hypothetical protein
MKTAKMKEFIWFVIGAFLIAFGAVLLAITAKRFWTSYNAIVNTPNCRPSFVGQVGIEHLNRNRRFHDPRSDGFSVWFTLIDDENNETCTNGKVTLSVDGGADPEFDPSHLSAREVYRVTWDLHASDFVRWTFIDDRTGATSLKRIWHSRRIWYAESSGLSRGYPRLQAAIVVRTSAGQILSGQSTWEFQVFEGSN